MNTQTPVVKLDVYLENQLTQTAILAETKIKLGRLKSAHVSIDDPRICRLHAMVEAKSADDVSVLDLGSVGGTYLNGHRVTRAPLTSGDRLALGPYTLVVSIAGARKATRKAKVPPFDQTEDPSGSRTLEVMAQWGKTLVDVQHLAGTGRYCIGDGPSVDHSADTAVLPINEYVLAEIDHPNLVVNIPDKVSGDLLIDGRVVSIDSLRTEGRLASSTMPQSRAIRLPAGARCRLRIGALSFFINSVPSAGRIPGPTLLSGIDRQFFRHLGGALGLHALFLLLVFSIPAAAGNLSMDTFSQRGRFVDITFIPTTNTAAPDVELTPTIEAGPTPQETSGSTAGSTNRADGGHSASPRTERPALTRGERRAVAKSVANTIRTQFDSQFSEMLQESGPHSADMEWIGTADTTAKEGIPRALPIIGGGRCRGANCAKSLVAGPVDTGVRGPGPRARIAPKQTRKPRIIPQRPAIEGALPMAVIARIIRQNRGGFRYCYERQLNREQGLAGKIKLEFVIGSDGRVVVAQVSESTMGNSAVEACLTKRMKQTRFPRPKDGGSVVVRYPFLFKSN